MNDFNEQSGKVDLLENVTAYFQPICSIGFDVVGYEALGRKIENGKAGTIWPYLENINERGLRPTLELATLKDSCALLRNLQQAGHQDLPFISVNLHALTLAEEDFSDQIEHIFTIYSEARDFIKFEILEDPFPKEHLPAILSNIEWLYQQGFALSLDDIDGENAFDNARLDSLSGKVKTIKFGKDFWKGFDADNSERCLETALTQIQRSGAKEVVFENVETDDQIKLIDECNRRLKSSNAEINVFMQGWHERLGKDIAPEIVITKRKNDNLAYRC